MVVFPLSISSSWLSMYAVNLQSTISGKFSHMSSVVTSPRGVGTSCLPSLLTYPREIMVVIIVAYVLGRPIPFSSRYFTSVASLYLAGGSVKCCTGVTLSDARISPTFISGSFTFSSSVFLSSVDSSYSAIYPGNFTVYPLVLKIYPSQLKSV